MTDIYEYMNKDDPNQNRDFVSIAERNSYKNKLKELNILLTMNGFSELGDLFDVNYTSLQKSIKTITSILKDRQKILDSKTELLQKINKIEQENLSIHEKMESFNSKAQDYINKIDFYKNKIILTEKKAEKDQQQIIKEKEDINKSYIKISLKESQYKHEIKKLENIIEELKNKLKKIMNDNKEIKIVDNKNERILISNNSVIFDNFLKNSPHIILNAINYSKDFYNLIYQAFDEKIKHLTHENEDLRQCIKLIQQELMQYIELKKMILYKFSKDNIEIFEDSIKDYPDLNLNILNLNFNDSKTEILQNFNDVINIFRFLLIYDVYKIDPHDEFDIEKIKYNINNKKFNLEDILYYKNIANVVENLNLDKLEDIKKKINSFNVKEMKKVEKFIPYQEEEENNYLAEQIEELEKDINDHAECIEDRFKELEDEIMNQIKNVNTTDNDNNYEIIG